MPISFDSSYYLEQYPDVAEAVENGVFESAQAHWEQFGAQEARNPNATFITSEYLAANPDVAAAVADGMNPLNHFINRGAAEGRAPSDAYTQVADNFDAEAYLADNPDVATAIEGGANLTAYKHWVLFGQYEEGRPEAQLTDGTPVSEVIGGEEVTSGLTEGLEELSGARDAVSAQKDDIADFLEGSYSNEFVKAEAADADGNNDGELTAEDVTETDVADAHGVTATALVDTADVNDSIDEDGTTFNGLSDAAQDARIATAQTDLDEAIATAQDAVDTSAEDLEAGVTSLAEEAQDNATALEASLDAQDAQDTATDEVYAAAGAVATEDNITASGTVEVQDSTAATPAVGQVEVTDGTELTDVTAVDSGEVSFTDAVSLNQAGTAYTVDLSGDGTVTTSISKSYLDSVLGAAQADVDAAADVTSAENALASSMVDVLEAQDSEFDGSDATFDSLVTNNAIDVSDNGAGTDEEVTLDYSVAEDNDGGATATGAADVDTYAGNLATLADKQSDKADFGEALTDWQGTEDLVDQLASLNSDLSDLNDAVTDALASIENDEDADPAGLGISLLEGADNFTTEDDVYLFAESEGDQAGLSGFGDSGEDQIYFGEGFSLVALGDNDISDNVGDINAQEIFWEQEGSNVNLYVEAETFGGNSAGDADVTQVTLTGVDGADISDNLGNGFLSAGTEVA